MNTNTATINKIAETAARLTSRAADLAVMTALTDAWNALTDEQRDDFTANVGDINTIAVAISLGGSSARLVTDDWHEEIGDDNPAAQEYVRALETLLADVDGGALLLGEMLEGADPEESNESYRFLYHTRSQLDSARDDYQRALADMTALLAAN